MIPDINGSNIIVLGRFEQIAQYLPLGISMTGRAIVQTQEQPFDAELPATRGMSCRRRQEFLAGRRSAREALISLGVEPCSIPRAPDRSPIFPRGTVGSISHSRGFAVAAAARADLYRSIGVDCERRMRVKGPLEAIVCRDDESVELVGWNAHERATCLFSAKEAVFKAWFTLKRRMIGFHAVRIFRGRTFGSFEARIHDKVSGAELAFEGLAFAGPDYVYMIAWVGVA